MFRASSGDLVVSRPREALEAAGLSE
jgi:hypothetical protein